MIKRQEVTYINVSDLFSEARVSHEFIDLFEENLNEFQDFNNDGAPIQLYPESTLYAVIADIGNVIENEQAEDPDQLTKDIHSMNEVIKTIRPMSKYINMQTADFDVLDTHD